MEQVLEPVGTSFSPLRPVALYETYFKSLKMTNELLLKCHRQISDLPVI
jgi:hypothetical protein